VTGGQHNPGGNRGNSSRCMDSSGNSLIRVTFFPRDNFIFMAFLLPSCLSVHPLKALKGEKNQMLFNMKHQGNILYLLGYLFYACNQPDTPQPYIWIICSALVFFMLSLLSPFFQKGTNGRKIFKNLTTASESAGWIMTLLFALSFIPEAQYIETHLTLFGLLVLTFLVTRNILPRLSRNPDQELNKDVKRTPAMDMPGNKS
jgi:hypothetical protein